MTANLGKPGIRRPPIGPVPCVSCGAPVPYQGIGAPRNTCDSPDCQRDAARERERRYERSGKRPKEDPSMSTSFTDRENPDDARRFAQRDRRSWERHHRHGIQAWPVAGCPVCEDLAGPDPYRPQ